MFGGPDSPRQTEKGRINSREADYFFSVRNGFIGRRKPVGMQDDNFLGGVPVFVDAFTLES
jgi:hypothetical protein